MLMDLCVWCDGRWVPVPVIPAGQWVRAEGFIRTDA